MNIATRLDTLLRTAQVPIHGVSVGRASDRGSWEVSYAVDATEEQRRAGAAVLATFDPVAEEQAAAELEVDQMLESSLVKAMLTAFAPALGQTPDKARAILRAELLKSGQ